MALGGSSIDTGIPCAAAAAAASGESACLEHGVLDGDFDFDEAAQQQQQLIENEPTCSVAFDAPPDGDWSPLLNSGTATQDPLEGASPLSFLGRTLQGIVTSKKRPGLSLGASLSLHFATIGDQGQMTTDAKGAKHDDRK